MKTRSSLGALICVVALPAWSVFARENLLTNGGFEQPISAAGSGIGRAPVHWSKASLSADKVHNAADSKSTFRKVAGGRMGKHAAALTLGKGDRWMYGQQGISLKDPLLLCDEVLFTLAARSPEPVEFDLYIEAWNTKADKGSTRRVRVTASPDWRTYEAKMPVTKGAEGLKRFRVLAQLYTPGASLLIDDARVTRASGALRRQAAKMRREAASRFESGKGVLTLDGKTRIVDLNHDALQLTNTPITVEAWLRTKKTQGVIFECGAQNREPGPQAGYALYMKHGGLRFGVNNSVEMYRDDLWDDVWTRARYNDGEWHHAAGVFHADGKTRVKLYVDGFEVTDARRSGKAQPGLSEFTKTDAVARIGSRTGLIPYPDPEEYVWEGALAEVGLWNRALTPKKVQDNWAVQIDPATPGLVGYWKFDEGASEVGDRIADAAGANHGVLAQFRHQCAIDDPFFPLDPNVFPEDDFDYRHYPANITGYAGQNLQRIAVVRWQRAERRRIGPRGNYKPGFTRLPNGNLVAAVCRRSPGYSESRENRFWLISVYESGDLGQSWKEISQTPLFGKEPALVATRKGALVLSAQEGDYRPGVKHGGANFFRSTDGGVTWRRIDVDDGQFPYPYPRNIMADKDGSLLCLRPRGADITLCRSTDDGLTWTFSPGTIDWDPEGENYAGRFAEIGVARLPDGRLLATLRVNFPRMIGHSFEGTYVTTSGDQGKTWSRPRYISNAGEVQAYPTVLADGRVLLTYTNYHHPFGVFAIVSSDGAKTWDREHPIQLALSADDETGWAVTHQLPDGSLATAYANTVYSEKDPPTTVCEVVRWRLP